MQFSVKSTFLFFFPSADDKLERQSSQDDVKINQTSKLFLGFLHSEQACKRVDNCKANIETSQWNQKKNE